jgi:hypothetical protein
LALEIETFKNANLLGGWRPGNNPGGETLFKALGHPLSLEAGRKLVNSLRSGGPVAIFDPNSSIGNFNAFFNLGDCDVEGYYVQRVEDLDAGFMGRTAKPLTDIAQTKAKCIFVLAFDADRIVTPFKQIFPDGVTLHSLDEMRLADDMLTNTTNYLDPINFATNFALLRDVADQKPGGGLHTRIVTANYWALHGAKNPELYCRLTSEAGEPLAEWRQALTKPGELISIDSREVRDRFDLPDFFGSLFLHAVGIAGHDVVKYALDIFDDSGNTLSCSHDANAWPADFYAGLPAAHQSETVNLIIQNSHPAEIPANAVGFNVMGSQDVTFFDKAIAPFGTATVDVGKMLPDAKWPDQIEIVAGRHFVRPRYEVLQRSNGFIRRRIAHANVERTDLAPDPKIKSLGAQMGKGYIMPLPILPTAEFSSIGLPTPMAREQAELPLKIDLIDGSGVTVASKFLGRLQRRESAPVEIDAWIKDEGLSLVSGFGHMEFLYDFRDGGDADGWHHALGRYTQRQSGHIAETIFGAHIYNTPIIYKDEPQSYTNKPPGLTTRLFLRLAGDYVTGRALDSLCHLIYPASLPWTALSHTHLLLHNGDGRQVAEELVEIPCSGSLFWRYSETFSKADRVRAGADGYVIIRDETCRLFGFHGILNGQDSFCLDHMFGF